MELFLRVVDKEIEPVAVFVFVKENGQQDKRSHIKHIECNQFVYAGCVILNVGRKKPYTLGNRKDG